MLSEVWRPKESNRPKAMTKIHTISLTARDLQKKNIEKTQPIENQSDKICIQKINYIVKNTPKSSDNAPYLFNTLAQLAHPLEIKELDQTKETLKKRAKAKYVTGALIHELTKIDSPLYKSYRNSYYCASVIEQKGQKLTSTYCNNRWCLVCNRIRTARLINGYMPELEAMKQPVFLTLTIPNVLADELRSTIEIMTSTFRNIVHRHTRRNEVINGLRKVECTYNPIQNTYHPHFHVIIDGWNNAELIRNKWLESFKNAVPVAQDIRPCKDAASMLELFKYFTKLMTNKDEFYPLQMDIIFQAMRGKRVYQPFGNIHPVKEDVEEIETEEYKDIVNDDRLWTWFENDWIDKETGECLTGYEVEETTQKLCARIEGQDRPSEATTPTPTEHPPT